MGLELTQLRGGRGSIFGDCSGECGDSGSGYERESEFLMKNNEFLVVLRMIKEESCGCER